MGLKVKPCKIIQTFSVVLITFNPHKKGSTFKIRTIQY